MPSSPSVGRKLPQLKLRIRRSRSICSTGRFVFVVFIIIFIAVLLFALPRFPARSGTIALGRRGVEDTYRRSEAWNSGKIQQNPFNVNRTDDDKGDSLEQNTESRPKVLGVVGIQTGFGSYERRKALRDTWMPSSPEGLSSLEQSTGLAIRFVIGHTPDATKMAELEKEIKIYKDFIRIDVDEDYHKLTFKTLAFFKAAYQLFDADFYVKADDDIYLRPDRLATLLAKDRSASRTYLGCMKKGPVITDPRQKWYEPLGYLLGNEYFYHAYGPIYALSAEVVSGLTTMKSNSFRMFSNEDVTIGAWMLAMNVEHEDNRAICQPSCTADSIAVWDIPKCSGLCNAAEKLRELHHMDICSKSPTLAD